MSTERIIDLVFSRKQPNVWPRALVASIGAVSVYGAGSGLLLGSEQFLAEWSQMLSGRIGAALDRVLVVERPSPPPVARTPEEPRAPIPPTPNAPGSERRELARAAVRPPVFAQAASIVARDPEPSEVVDLTGNTFVTGMGTVYGGGFTRSGGMSKAALRGSVLSAPDPRRAASSSVSTSDRSRPVGLPSPTWSCPWPVEAETESINEQTAVIQVTTRPDGSVETAVVLVDPGYGFGDAARRCALESRFVPARDRLGEAIRASSPPIRVRFVR